MQVCKAQCYKHKAKMVKGVLRYATGQKHFRKSHGID
jgi:hypothetical protein